MPLGVLVGLLSYSIYSCGDALVKSFSGELGVFEIGFFSNIFALVPAVFAKRPGEHWAPRVAKGEGLGRLRHEGSVHARREWSA